MKLQVWCFAAWPKRQTTKGVADPRRRPGAESRHSRLGVSTLLQIDSGCLSTGKGCTDASTPSACRLGARDERSTKELRPLREKR